MQKDKHLCHQDVRTTGRKYLMSYLKHLPEGLEQEFQTVLTRYEAYLQAHGYEFEHFFL
jgi:hypothetical protein